MERSTDGGHPNEPESRPERPSSHRRSRRRRRRGGRQRSSRRVWIAVMAVVLLAVVGGVFWAHNHGWRGPRFLERWPAPSPGFGPWEPLEPGIDYARARLDLPRPIRCHALRIDLTRPDLEIVVPRGVVAAPLETFAEWPITWLHRHELRAVINATPFNPAPIFPGRPTRLLGLAVSDGARWCDPSGNLDNFVVTTNGSVRLLAGRMPVGEPRQAAGGFLIIRRGGVNVGETSVLDATTAVGLSADRRWMYWLVVDGGQPGYSEGVTPQEASELMGSLGASDALRMDGGASSAMAVASRGWGGAVLNRSRNPVYDGAPRPVGNVIGVRRKATPPAGK